MKHQDSFTQDNSRLGSELSPRDQATVLNQFVHRMTVENKRRFPDYARRQIAGGYRMPEKTDAQWLAETRFATNSAGQLNQKVENCEQDHDACMRDLAIVKAQDEAKRQAIAPSVKTLPFNCAAQIASDIRGDCLPDRLPAYVERRLEATIDAVLAVERAKVAALIKAAESVVDCPDYRDVRTHEMAVLRSALFALQA